MLFSETVLDVVVVFTQQGLLAAHEAQGRRRLPWPDVQPAVAGGLQACKGACDSLYKIYTESEAPLLGSAGLRGFFIPELAGRRDIGLAV